MAVVPVKLVANGRCFTTYALFDSGAEITVLQRNALKFLGLNPPKKTMQMGTLHGDGPLMEIQHADVKILSLSDSFSIFAVEVPAIKSLNLHNFVVDWSLKKSKFPHLQDLDIGAIDYAKVTILLGSDHQEAHEELEVRKPAPNKNGPLAIKSVFGWFVRGSLATKADLRHP